VQGNLTIKVNREATGRAGFHLKSDAPTEHVAVQDFVLRICSIVEAPEWARVLESERIARRVAEDIRGATRVGLNSRYWRGREFSESAREIGPEDFGAPPSGKQSEGRYNPGGSRVLYLARDAATAGIECSRRPEASNVWVQEFSIQLPHYRWLRLELDMEERYPHLHYLLLDSEYLPDASAKFANVRNPYRATHFVVHVAEQLGIAAVEYPSIRRKNGVNLVVLGRAVPIAERMTTRRPRQG
jgi:hypothetical protein